MGWKLEARKRINLPEELADGLWIETPHPKMIPYEPMKRMLAMAKSSGAEGQSDEESAKHFDLDSAIDLANSLVLNWNLTDPNDPNGDKLPIPSEDASVWEKIPAMEIVKLIFGELKLGADASLPDPNS